MWPSHRSPSTWRPWNAGLKTRRPLTSGTASLPISRSSNEIRDDLGYLRVKARRGETVTRTERQRLSDRVERFLTRINNNNNDANRGVNDRDRTGDRSRAIALATAAASARHGPWKSPVGTEVDVRLVTPLTSDTAQVEDRVEATTMVDLYNGNDMIVPAGSVMTGWVTSVDRASRTDRQGKLTARVQPRAHQQP